MKIRDGNPVRRHQRSSCTSLEAGLAPAAARAREGERTAGIEAMAHQPDAGRHRRLLSVPARRCAPRIADEGRRSRGRRGASSTRRIATARCTRCRRGFAGRFARTRKASEAWDALIPSRKKEILRYFSWLKSAEARERNVARAIHVLSGKGAASWPDRGERVGSGIRWMDPESRRLPRFFASTRCSSATASTVSATSRPRCGRRARPTTRRSWRRT